MIAFLLFVSARAATGTVELHAVAGTGRSERPELQGFGAGAALGVQPVPRLSLEGRVETWSLASPGWRVDVRPEARWWLTDPAAPRGAVSGSVGAGLGRYDALDEDPEWRPRVAVAAAADFPITPRVSIRVAAGPVFDGSGIASLRVAAGPVVGPARELSVEPARAELPRESPEPLTILPPTARVWIPHPVCQWVPVAEVPRWAAELPRDQVLRLVALGHLPRDILPGASGLVRLDPAPAQGSLLVAGRPGDRVTVGGVAVPVGSDGVALVSAAEGAVSLRVVGGGRAYDEELAVSSGYAGYLRVPEPKSVEVRFARGSAILSEADAERLRALAALAGDWAFEVRGGHSPEGGLAANQALAAARARAVAELLVAGGIPAERVRTSVEVVESAGLDDPTRLRRAMVVPLPGSSP